MCVDSEVVVASLSILTISILKRTMSMRNELFAADFNPILCTLLFPHPQPYSATSMYYLTQPRGFGHFDRLAPIDRMMTPGNRYVSVSHPSQSSSRTTVGLLS